MTWAGRHEYGGALAYAVQSCSQLVIFTIDLLVYATCHAPSNKFKIKVKISMGFLALNINMAPGYQGGHVRNQDDCSMVPG